MRPQSSLHGANPFYDDLFPFSVHIQIRYIVRRRQKTIHHKSTINLHLQPHRREERRRIRSRERTRLWSKLRITTQYLYFSEF